MAGTVVSSPRGAEISERSSELVLPDASETGRALDEIAPPSGREFDVSEAEVTRPTFSSAQTASRESANASSKASAAPDSDANAKSAPRGAALPGDRGPRNQRPQAQRPSFWRRIALGRRAAEPEPEPEPAPTPAPVEAAPKPTLAERARNAVTPAPSATADMRAVETRIVEPMLQALVSVESKLERSHTELVGRSDQVEQRLTQLWDIEEQLGALGELQESLLQVSEQQRRLETAVVAQTRTLRWLVGAVFFSLAAAAFVVAAVI